VNIHSRISTTSPVPPVADYTALNTDALRNGRSLIQELFPGVRIRSLQCIFGMSGSTRQSVIAAATLAAQNPRRRALSRLESSGLIKIVGRHESSVEVCMLVPETFRGQFILGPIDLSWILRAGRLGVKALLCGLALWYLHGLRRKCKTHDSKAVSNLALDGWGISPDAKRRALLKLANVGLIEAEYRNKRSPCVTILSPYAKGKAKGGVGTKQRRLHERPPPKLQATVPNAALSMR
jgi:hypothetical protein